MSRQDRLIAALFAALLFSLGFLQVPIIESPRLLLTDVVFVVLFAAWSLSVVFGRAGFRMHPFFYLLALYISALIVSSVFSESPRTSFVRLAGEAYLAALCIVAFNLCTGSSLIKGALAAWLAGAAFASALGILTVLVFYTSPGNPLLEHTTYHFGAVPAGYYPRITSTFASASMFCNYLNASLAIAFAARWLSWINTPTMLVLTAAILICSVFTFSVGLGGIFLAAGVWYWAARSGERRYATVIGIAGILLAVIFLILSLFALYPYQGAAVIATLPVFDDPLMPSGRLLVWQHAMSTFADNMLTGRGLGLPVANVLFTNSDGSHSLLTDAHNIFLNVAAQNGLPALVSVILMTGYLLLKWVRSLRQLNGSLLTVGLGLAVFCSFVYQGLTGSFEEARHIWVLIGIFLAGSEVEKTAD